MKKEINISSEELVKVYEFIKKDIDNQMSFIDSDLKYNLNEKDRKEMQNRSANKYNALCEIKSIFMGLINDAVKSESYLIHEDTDYHYKLKTIFLNEGVSAVVKELTYKDSEETDARSLDEIEDYLNTFKKSSICLSENTSFRVDNVLERMYLEEHQYLQIECFIDSLRDEFLNNNFDTIYDIENKMFDIIEKQSGCDVNIVVANLKQSFNNVAKNALYYLKNSSKLNSDADYILNSLKQTK